MYKNVGLPWNTISMHVTTQCLASWFSCQETSWIFYISCQDLGKVRKILQDFQDRGKESKKIFGLLGKKTKTTQDLGKRNKKSLHQSNTRSIDVL